MRDQPSESVEPPPDDVPVTWWRPTWRDVLATVGWGWIILTVAVFVAAVALVVPLLVFSVTFAAALFKPAILLLGGAAALTGRIINRAIHARREPFCIFCGYCLTGLPDGHRCPECGRPYTWQQIDDYRRDPKWFIERWKARQALPPPDSPVEAGPARPRKRSRDGTG